MPSWIKAIHERKVKAVTNVRDARKVKKFIKAKLQIAKIKETEAQIKAEAHGEVPRIWEGSMPYGSAWRDRIDERKDWEYLLSSLVKKWNV